MRDIPSVNSVESIEDRLRVLYLEARKPKNIGELLIVFEDIADLRNQLNEAKRKALDKPSAS